MAQNARQKRSWTDREKRVEKLTLRDLDSFEHERFAKQWENVQARFVDSPKGSCPGSR
jgi:hypothetical protein